MFYPVRCTTGSLISGQKPKSSPWPHQDLHPLPIPLISPPPPRPPLCSGPPDPLLLSLRSQASSPLQTFALAVPSTWDALPSENILLTFFKILLKHHLPTEAFPDHSI